MIQTPINVRPQNYAVDTTRNPAIYFNFKGDYLSGIWYKIFDYDTGELAKEWKYYSGQTFGYNDTLIADTSHWYSSLTNGHNYLLQMMLIQKNAACSSVVCDMPVLSGNVGEKQSELGNLYTIIVAKDITSIYPWGENNGTYTPTDYSTNVSFCRMVLQIGDERKEIVSYTNDSENGVGIITTDGSFTSVTAGMPYRIYANYLITPQYYFECRSTPSVTFTHTLNDKEIYCHGVYNQTENDLIKYYQLSLVWSNNSGFQPTGGGGANKAEIVETTDRIYSQNIDYYFHYPYRHDENSDDAEHSTYGTDYYKIICDITTQSGQTVSIENTAFGLVPDTAEQVEYGNTLYAFDLQWDGASGRVLHTLRGYGSAGIGVTGTYELTREDLMSGEVVQLLPHHFAYGEVAEIIGYDLTASTHGKYRYTLKLYNSDGEVIIPKVDDHYDGIGHFPCNEIEMAECAYYITELNERVSTGVNNRNYAHKKYFDIGDTWVFRGEIQDTTVTNNLDREAHVGYSRYITATSTDVNYMSGTLTTMLGYVNCADKKYTDDISLVNAWRRFITQKKCFLLKSQKGDVWIVDIVNTPTTTYLESHPSIMTTISFDWAECYGLDEVVIFDPDD